MLESFPSCKAALNRICAQRNGCLNTWRISYTYVISFRKAPNLLFGVFPNRSYVLLQTNPYTYIYPAILGRTYIQKRCKTVSLKKNVTSQIKKSIDRMYLPHMRGVRVVLMVCGSPVWWRLYIFFVGFLCSFFILCA